jgi:hypothetical protein
MLTCLLVIGSYTQITPFSWLIFCDDVAICVDVAFSNRCQVSLVGPTLLNCANNQLPHVILCLCFGLVINCHVAFCCRGANRVMTRGFPFPVLCATIVTHVLTWHYPEVATWTTMMRWPYGWGATWHLWGPHPIEILPCGTHLCWRGQMARWHVALFCWLGSLTCCHVSCLLSLLI